MIWLNYILVNIILSVINLVLTFVTDANYLLMTLANIALLGLWYFLVFRKKPADRKLLRFYLWLTAVVFIVFAIFFKISGGQFANMLNFLIFIPLFPFFPFLLFAMLMPQYAYLPIGGILVLHCLILFIWFKGKQYLKQSLIVLAVIAICSVFSLHTYRNRDELKYSGHGFQYMMGFSSTDFTDYHVYSNPSKLVTLDHQPEIYFTNENEMPIMDGAEACYPLYNSVAKAIYKDIDKIELAYSKGPKLSNNGKIVTFTNTVYGYKRLIDRECDLLFGARPSQQQVKDAAEQGITFELTQIGSEAFVFFVEKDNPVDNLTADQVRQIYHGTITNWNQVGGPNQKIVAFQRPEGSGSQTMMLYFMGDLSLKEPKSYETFSAMDGIVSHVANYNNEDGALGYSFRYFIEELMEEENVKLLSIDGVQPTVENIRNGSYPLVTPLYCVTRANDANPSVRKVLDFLLSPDGQYIIEKTGYAGLNQ